MKISLHFVVSGLALLAGLSCSHPAKADTVNWAAISYAPNAATAIQKTQVGRVNGTNISVLFSNNTYDSTFVQSPGTGSYAATTSGNTNAVYANGGNAANYGLQLVTNFSTSTNAGSSGSFISGASDTVTVFFSKPVLNVSFTFYDIDQGTLSGGVYTDFVSNIFGMGTGGATIAPISLTPSNIDNKLVTTANIATTGFLGTGSANQNVSDGNATVVFDSTHPITQFSYTYGDTATAGSTHSPLQIIALGNVGYTVAPEPSTWAMLGLGAAAAAAAAYRKRRNKGAAAL